MTADILQATACELGRRLRAQEFSCEELTNFYLQRIHDINPAITAFTHVAHRSAKRAARQWDRARKLGRIPRHPLSGVPTAIKDMSLVRMMPVRFGSRATPPIWSPIDDQMTRRIRNGGLILLGKLATSEFGAIPVTEPDLHPPTRNPFQPEFTPGGSSGGSGAAVAAGMIPIAHGEDGGGSIRIPSALGHLVGLKASRGVLVHGLPADADLRLTVMGPLARSVEDLIAFLELFTGWPQHWQQRINQPLPRSTRIRFSTKTPLCGTDAAHQRAVLDVVKILESGCDDSRERAWIDIDVAEFLVLWKRTIANVPRWLPKARMQPVTRWLYEAGIQIPLADAVKKRVELETRTAQWFDDADLWISPTVACSPPQIGSWRREDPEDSFREIVGLGAYTAVYNVSGQPAISIPVGFSPLGVPIGVQIAGKVGQDALVLQAARLVEKARGGFAVPPPDISAAKA